MGPEELIGRFTEHLSRMQFDKAKEFAELEKMRTNWADFSSLDEEHWPAFMTVLAQLANLESLYFSFSYMLTKFSFRKENNIRDIYAQMRTELARIEASYQQKPPENVKGLANSLQQIVSEFGRFFLIRSNLVGFYMHLPVKEWRAFEEDSYVTASKVCLSFENGNDGKSHCFALFKKEFELLKLSYRIHQAIQECNAIDALLMLKSSRDLLEDWFCSLDACPATKPSGSFFLSFGSRRRSSVSRLGLLQFLLQFHHILVAKFTLYFHDTFVPFAPHNEMKHTLPSQVSFLQLFNTFVRKSNVHTICLLLNRIDQDKQFQGFGYNFSSHSSSTATEGDAPQSHDNDEQISTGSRRHIAIKNESTQSGLSDKYPALLFIPSERRHDHCHYATICSFVQEGFCGNGTNTGGGTGNTAMGGNVSTSNANLAVESSASAGNKIRYLYDKNKEQTFFTAHVEANIHLVITFDRRVQERESAIHGFLGEALNNLRCTKLFQEIKNIGK